MPKSKANKKKSLLDNAKDSSNDAKTSEVFAFGCCLLDAFNT